MADTHYRLRGAVKWFNSPDDAAKAGCPAAVTPFNGEQHAGIQTLSTRTFPDNQGPLALVHR